MTAPGAMTQQLLDMKQQVDEWTTELKAWELHINDTLNISFALDELNVALAAFIDMARRRTKPDL